ncbi:lanthionine synthetase C family protein [Micromonospora sp. WMMD1082]|uniref:lanthionine synthetase C family protein n=1 Tax=Micromonospora sp. WMMD1082 TaxID=3016104 RepID=UPI0024163B49|nr:lanthionine synthetase C family protein [Micromonospora sp. WMMD1082]MDG4795152.1 lanthionine synthetase C family protein [Micromonospora sp. WMMD1082]
MTILSASPDVLDVVAATAATLTDPMVVEGSPDGRTRPQSLAGGAAGIALLHVERALTGRGNSATAHAWLRAAASEPVSAGPNADLFNGAPTLAFLLHTARPLGRYQQALTTLDDATIAITRDRLAAAHARIDRRDPLTMREFDLVHGLTGLGVYHLQAHPDHQITHDVLAYLACITDPLDANALQPPWWLPSGLGGTRHPDFPHGHGNLGVAHGISAVLAVLALALLRGHTTPRLHGALTALCAWTDQHRQDNDPTGTWWPGYVTTEPTAPRRHRPSWCYGTAGTARAQQLAGLALGDSNRQRHAENAMLAVLRDPIERARLPEIGLCHGKAGLLQAACRMAAASTNPQWASDIAAELPGLAADLATHLTNDQPTEPELLNGTAGAALALHTTATGTPATCWDAFLALA